MDATFERLENDAVDEFLDRYYSLEGEWIRFFKLAGGTEHLEDYLAEKVRETFEQEEWYADINAAFERLLSSDKKVRIAYEQKVRDILGRNRLDWHRAAVDVTLTASLEEILQLSFQQDLILSARRFLGAGAAGSAVGGGVATIVARKITAKLRAKIAPKLAAKAPIKALRALLSKMAASAAGGATAGATGGSVVPGVGTAAGLVGGTLVGLATSVALDALLLELEEVLNRDDFKREIVAAIREARCEFEEEYLGVQHSAKAAIP